MFECFGCVIACLKSVLFERMSVKCQDVISRRRGVCRRLSIGVLLENSYLRLLERRVYRRLRRKYSVVVS